MALRILSDLLAGPAFARESLLRFRDEGGWTEMSGPALAATARQLAAAIAGYGAEPTARVAILSRGGPEGLVAELAAHACGAVSVPLDGALPDGWLLERLRESRARLALVSEPALLERLLAMRPELEALDLALLFRPPDGGRAPAATLVDSACRAGADLLGRDPGLLEGIARTTSTDTPAYLFPARRGGGRGCLVPVSHSTSLAAAAALARALGLGPSDRVLLRLPSEEGHAQAAALACLVSGAAIVYGRPGADLRDELPEAGATSVLASPSSLESLRVGLEREIVGWTWPRRAIARWAVGQGRRRAERSLATCALPSESTLAHRIADRLVLRGLRATALGAATRVVSIGPPLSDGASGFFLAIGVALLGGFGLAEAGGVLSLSEPKAVRPGTAGRLLPGFEVRTGRNGEIELASPSPAAGPPRPPGPGGSAAGRWIPTGWKGGLDPQGFLRIEGRAAA